MVRFDIRPASSCTKRVYIGQIRSLYGLLPVPHLLEEAARRLNISHQRPFRDAIVCSPVMAILNE
jgi:hypothetical protein